MTTIGMHKIVGQMFRGPMTLTEITNVTGLKKPTIHYHMKNLIEQGIAHYDPKKGTYSVKINDELKQIILDSLKNKKNLDELSKELKQKASDTKSSTLNLLLKDKELTKKLNDILEFLYLDDLVTVTEENILSGTIFKTEEHWTLTWKGCAQVGLCHVCRKPINTQAVLGVIAHTISNQGEFFLSHRAPLIHTKCVARASSDYVEFATNEYIFDNDLCDYCGLPLSEKRIRAWLQDNLHSSSIDIIYPFLTLDEINTLNAIRKNELITQFSNRFDKHSPSKTTFEGDLLTKNKFYDEKFGTFTPLDEPFEFLKTPKFSDVEKLLRIIQKNKPFDLNRAKELFREWLSSYKIIEEKINQLLYSLFSNPAAMIYPKIWHTLPGPHDVSDSRLPPPEIGGIQTSQGYSFVIKDKDNKSYHESCFHNFSKLNPISEKYGGAQKR